MLDSNASPGARRARHAGGGPLSGAAGDGGGIALLPLSCGLRLRWTGITSKLIADYLSSSSWGAVSRGGATGLVAGVGYERDEPLQNARHRVAAGRFRRPDNRSVMLAAALSGESWASTPMGGWRCWASLRWWPRGQGVLGRS